MSESRCVGSIRSMLPDEIALARMVFKSTIPYNLVVISDGLGAGGAPFTMPTSIPIGPCWGVSPSSGKYVIHAGDDGFQGLASFNGMYAAYHISEGKKTLIHELTHVWQGEHSNWSWAYVLESANAQGQGSDRNEAYVYKDEDKDFLDYTPEEQGQVLKEWDEYNPEQQALIVEDWFADGMHDEAVYPDAVWKDLRFYFIKKYIRGEEVSNDISFGVPPNPPSIPIVDPKDLVIPPDRGQSSDAYLLSLLQQRFRADDVAGYGGRVRKLDEYFGKLPRNDARILLVRLQARRPGDKVAQYFHDHLSTATRVRLMGMLQSK